MSSRVWISRILPFVAISGALIVATLSGDYALHRLGLVWIGRYLGIPGVLLIVAALGYSLRKRKVLSWGKRTRWIAFHEFGAWLPATFEHQRHFPLEGDHNVSCATCHANKTYREYSCYGCHEHTIDHIRREHREEGIRSFDDRVRCHRSGRESDED